jgi:hypothetical protein
MTITKMTQQNNTLQNDTQQNDTLYKDKNQNDSSHMKLRKIAVANATFDKMANAK